MALNVERVAQLGIVRDWQGKEMKPEAASLSSYHLTVGRIISPSGKVGDPVGFTLKPQEVVTVVTHERLNVPETVFGYIMPRYTLNDRGILALSTGIVDPCYEGLVSSTLINFSDEDFELIGGQPFLRVTFHEIEPLRDDKWSDQIKARQSSYNRIPSADYAVERKQMAKKFPETFLNVPLTAEKVATRVARAEAEARLQSASVLLSKGATAVALITLVVAIVIFLLTPVTSELTTSSISDRVSARIANDEIEPIEEEILELRQDVNKLQNK